ncbi:SgcJ/EcaC family oxidoreductase [Mycolicibacterium sp. P1-5]|uniref:SgcJ/EcaC family oxidoreductase n=1 Tax=Mycolicibacterium sp. P1-5 TaxID=2024617 RepID=UPI0011EF01EF|nr:SgcJ/EcaC family oxidoreductase [Mycolicibacterium sp. P1-5]KAA0100520.1 SgcJ/EcaC family oxidoreductase [Mycolicibacterium sp. P1-5]
MPDTERLLRSALDQWKAGIDAHDPQAVAAAFTADAIFQGLRPFSVGRTGVFDYYDSQPAGMTVDYSVLESRRVGDDAVLGYVAATFTFRDGETKELRVGIVLTRVGDDWRIEYYQASLAAD